MDAPCSYCCSFIWQSDRGFRSGSTLFASTLVLQWGARSLLIRASTDPACCFFTVSSSCSFSGPRESLAAPISSLSHLELVVRNVPSHLIYLSPARVIGAPQMISQPVSSIFPRPPLPSGTLRTPELSIPQCCLLTSSSVCLVFLPSSLCLAKWFWPDLMNGRHDRTRNVPAPH